NPVSLQYDSDNLLIGAGNLTINRNPQNGLVTGTALGNIRDAWSYNNFAEPIGYSAAYNDIAFYTLQYFRDSLGRITQKTETIAGTTRVYNYTYDVRGRLTEVRKDGTTTSTYTYDSNGNRLTGPGVSTTAYDDQDRLAQY